jgi:PhzF family phenazine biosynthesis protein
MNVITLYVVNAFVESSRGGNPAGIVFDADSLTPETKQFIAAQAGLSETAFVSKSDLADFKLEFFTPTKQIPHCGHATIATFSYLVQQGRISGSQSSKETIDGTREILISGEMAFMEQKAPRYWSLNESTLTVANVLDSLGLTATDLIQGKSPTIVSTGNAFMVIPVQSEAALAAIAPNWEAIAKISETLDLIGYYVYTSQTQVNQRDAAARMFAPYYGIQEEAATGMAAGPLACFLYDQVGIKQREFLIEQGYLMQPSSPSVLTVQLNLEDGQIQNLMVGGTAIVSKTMEIELG